MLTERYKKCDTHLHPNLLHKPEQAEAFIEKAISLGFDMICFTDHMHHPDFEKDDRLPLNAVAIYCKKVKELARKYASEITILCGIEVDYRPQEEGYIRSMLHEGEFDHILGSTHMHLKVYGLPFSQMDRDSFAKLALENTLACVKTGLFDTVSHLDFFRWAFTQPQRAPLMESEYHLEKHIPAIEIILATLEQQNVCLEVNASGIYKGFDNNGPHPEYRILELAAKHNLQYVYGSDAHKVENVGSKYDEIVTKLKDMHISIH